MPTINISGASGSDPRQNKGAAWDAYEKSQEDTARKNGQVDSAFGKREAEHASQMEALWKQQASQMKAQVAAESRMLQQEMQVRNTALANEKAREADRKRQHNVMMRAEQSRLRAQQNQQTNARLNANAENSNRNYIAGGMRSNANAENTNRSYILSGIRANANAENTNRSHILSGIRANASAENANRNYIDAGIRADARAENSNKDAVKRAKDKKFREDYALAMRENQDRDRIARLDPNTYRAENVGRLGLQGMRSAERNDWRGLHQSERELDQIQRRFGNNPGVAAALKQARGRINAGSEGNPGWLMSLGRATGAVQDLGLLEGGGYALGGAAGGAIGMGAYAAFKAGKAVLDAPMTISNQVNSMVGAAAPYMQMRTGLSNMGRVSGVNSRDLEAGFSGRQDWMRRYGLSAPDASDLLGQYGIAPYNVGQGVGAVRSIAGAAYEMGVAPSGVARSAGNASNLGMTNQLNVDQYLRKLQQVTQVAVSQGMNRSQATEVLEGLYKQATTANTATLGSGSGISDLWSRMMQAGTTSARSGASTASMLAGANTFSDDVGFNTQNPARAQALSSYIQRHGGTKAFGADGDSAIISMIGKDAYDKIAQTPGGQESLRRAREAAGKGDMGLLMNNLSPILAGNVGATQNIINGSVFGDVKGGYGDLARQNLSGATPQAYNDYTSTKGASVGSATGADGRDMYQKLLKQGWPAKAAADMVANAYVETGGTFDPKSHNEIGGGHVGIFQLGVARQKLFKQQMGFDIRDPRATTDAQLDFNNWELSHTEKATGDVLRSGKDLGPGISVFSLGDLRPGSTPEEKTFEAKRRGSMRDRIMGPLAAGDSNSNADVNGVVSDAGNMANTASKTGFDRVKSGDEALGATLINISSGAERLNRAFLELATTASGLTSMMAKVNGGASPYNGMPSLNPTSSSSPYDLTPLRKG